MKRRLAINGILLAIVVALCGCGGGGKNPDEARIERNFLALMQGWANEDLLPFELYISENYAFDEQGKADHIAAIQADFAWISNFRLLGYSIDLASADLAYVRANATMQIYADVAALDYPQAIVQWSRSDQVLEQIWVRDFDGVWRLGAEFVSRGWVLGNTPSISDVSVQPGAVFLPGSTRAVYGLAVGGDDLRVTLWPDSAAAAGFSPESVYGFGSASYSGNFVVRSDAWGEYAFTFIGQTDRLGQAKMVGRNLWATFIEVQQTLAPSAKKKNIIAGNRISMFRHLRIKGARASPPGAPRRK
jgi:hypothetical protein